MEPIRIYHRKEGGTFPVKVVQRAMRMFRHAPIWAILTAALGITLVTAQASEQKPSTLTRLDSHCVCEQALNDTLENPKSFNFGQFEGQCVDSCRFRRSDIFKSENGNSLEITNFMHANRFWTLKLANPKVESVEIGFEEFQRGVYHVFLFFRLNHETPALLFGQGADSKTENAARKLYSIAFSPEGIPPRNQKYNLFDAYFERYVVGHRLISADQLISYSVKKLKHRVRLYKLRIPQEKYESLFEAALQSANDKSFKTKYRLFSNNCSTNILDLIDHVAPIDSSGTLPLLSSFSKIERALSVEAPIGTLRILSSRDLIDRGNPSVIEPASISKLSSSQ